ncbi:MAG: hypothetical protein Q4B26_04740 [Eubacteriales bacterium]|nr:hypothetical protein [Eubacteriales bacterium]
MKEMIYTESIRGFPYRNYRDTAKEFGISEATVKARTKEIRGQIGKRYQDYALIEDGNIVMINQLVFIDWQCNRRKLMDHNMKKYVPVFDPAAVAAYSGWSNRPVVEGKPSERETEISIDNIVDKVMERIGELFGRRKGNVA